MPIMPGDTSSALSSAQIHFRHSECTRSKIDDELRILAEKQRILRAQRNAVCAFFILAPETISDIFYLTAHVGRTSPSSPTSVRRLMGVCREWRDIALGDPRLWSRLLPMDVETTRLWLLRSKCAPLDVNFTSFSDINRRFARDDRSLSSYGNRRHYDPYPDYDYPSLPDDYLYTGSRRRDRHADFASAHIVIAHIDRVRSLRLDIPGNRAADPALYRAAPLLEALSIGVEMTFASRYGSPGGRDDLANGAYLLPPDLFAGSAPRLRTFCLKNCGMIDWASPVLSHLTSLSLTRVPASSRPTVSAIRDILERCPVLADLKLYHAFQPAHEAEGRDDAALQLHCLAQISIDASGMAGLAILDHITPSPNAIFDLHFDSFETRHDAASGSPTESARLLGPLQFFRRLGNSSPPFIAFKKIDYGSIMISTKGIAVSGSTPPYRMHSYRSLGAGGIGVRNEPDISERPSFFTFPLRISGVDAFLLLRNHLSFAELQELDGIGGECSSQVWNEIGATCPQLRFLSIHGTGTASFITALADDASPTPALFMKLVELQIMEHRFIAAEVLVECLLCRREHGLVLEKLVIRDCEGFSQAHYDVLCAIIADPYWDGYDFGGSGYRGYGRAHRDYLGMDDAWDAEDLPGYPYARHGPHLDADDIDSLGSEGDGIDGDEGSIDPDGGEDVGKGSDEVANDDVEVSEGIELEVG